MYPRENLRRAMALYAVTDRAWLGERTLSACVEEALAGGATFVQLREKDAPGPRWCCAPGRSRRSAARRACRSW